jgi:copper chaperone
MNRIELKIDGMSCEHCVSAVKEGLAHIDCLEIESVGMGRAVVTVNSEGDEPAVFLAIKQAIEDEGYSIVD